MRGAFLSEVVEHYTVLQATTSDSTERAAALLGCILFVYKRLGVEELACSFAAPSIIDWLKLLRCQTVVPESTEVDFTRVRLDQVRQWEAVCLEKFVQFGRAV